MVICRKLFVLCLLSLSITLVSGGGLLAMDKNKDARINCDIQKTTCTQPVSGGRVTFDIRSKPVKAMTDLTFEVIVADLVLTAPPMIDLSMPGMKMGKNQVQMKLIRPGVYQGTGVIVRCPSGKTIWQATVNLPGNDRAEFIFDVIY